MRMVLILLEPDHPQHCVAEDQRRCAWRVGSQ